MSPIGIIILYTVGISGYLLTLHVDYPAKPLAKAAPILMLAALALGNLPSGIALMVTCALLFSAAGDITLELERERSFVIGLGFFLIAHLLYVVALAQSLAFMASSLIPLLVIAAFAFGLTQRLYPKLGSLRIPVLLYIGVIIAMAVAAALHTPFNPLLVLGALIFMFSDATIAYHKFIDPVPRRDFVVMATYYFAQLLLVLGFLV